MVKVFVSFGRNLHTRAFILFLLLIASCDQPKKTDAAVQHPDSLSVKKMDADSNSDMPVAIPKDSSVTMPNAYDPHEKQPASK